MSVDQRSRQQKAEVRFGGLAEALVSSLDPLSNYNLFQLFVSVGEFDAIRSRIRIYILKLISLEIIVPK